MSKKTLAALTISLLAACAPGEPPAEGEFQSSPPQTAMPTPVLKAKRTDVAQAKLGAVDVHFHGGRLASADDYRGLAAELDEVGVAMVWSMDGGDERPLEQDLELAEAIPGRLVHFARLNYEGINESGWSEREAEKLQQAFDLGAAGLKVWKDVGLEFQNPDGSYIHVDDPRFDSIWQTCARNAKPVLMHLSDPPARFEPIGPANERFEAGMWRDSPEGNFYGSGKPHFNEIFEHRERMLAAHPETTFVLAHMASMGWDLARVASLLESFPNAHVELAARLQELGRQPYTTRRFLIAHQDRVLFGTDGVPGRDPDQFWRPHWRFLETDDEYFDHPAQMFSPEGAGLQGRWKIHGVFLPDDVLEKIYRINALRLISQQ